MVLNELPTWEKPREKLLRDGAGRLSNAEILAILLQTGTPMKSVMDLAGEILSLDQSGIRFLADCRPEELRKVNGMGDAKVCSILAAVELGRRIGQARRPGFGRVSNSDEIASMYMERMRYETKERFLCLLMDGKGEIIEESEVSVGDLFSTAANPREIFTGAIRRCAACVVLLHNHPSGDPTPSEEDLKTTRRLIKVGELVGIPVIDHIIIGDGVYVSLKAEHAI